MARPKSLLSHPCIVISNSLAIRSERAGFGYEPGPSGNISWFVNDTSTWRILASAIGPSEETKIGQRLISEEPMVRHAPLPLSHLSSRVEEG
jgi:hypothetical protein